MLRSHLFLALLCACAAAAGCQGSAVVRQLSVEEASAAEAIRGVSERGREALPELREALGHSRPVIRQRAREAMARITGQWGSNGELLWGRSVAGAKNADRPLLVLHLFGNFDEEFC